MFPLFSPFSMFQCSNISLSVFRFSALYSAAASCTTSLSIIHIRARSVVSLSPIGSVFSPGSYVLESPFDLQHSLPNPSVRHNSSERLISLLSLFCILYDKNPRHISCANTSIHEDSLAARVTPAVEEKREKKGEETRTSQQQSAYVPQAEKGADHRMRTRNRKAR